MVCTMCDSKTRTSNSRFMSRGIYVWRRRTCPRCHSVFTTHENVDMKRSHRVQDTDGKLDQFVREKLFLSIYESLRHRQEAISDASGITDTTISKILAEKRLIIPKDRIVEITSSVLRRFDRAAYIRYISMNKF